MLAPFLHTTPGPTLRVPGVVYPPPEQLRRDTEAGFIGQSTLAEAFMATHAAHAHRPALVGPEGVITHGELDILTDRAAAALLDLGLAPLDRVVFQLPNCKELVIALLACFKANLIPVCALASHREREIGYLAQHAQARLHLVPGDDPKFDHVEFSMRMRAKVPSLAHTVVARGPAQGGARSLRELWEAQDPATARVRVRALPRDSYQVALFQLSGGTTGVPKIIPRSSGDYVYNMRAVVDWFGFGPGDCFYNPMPLIHNFNLVCCSAPMLLAGGAIALAPTLDAETVMGILRRDKPTWFTLPGPLLDKLQPAIASGAVSFSHARGSITSKGADTVEKLTGVPTYHVFGMTEGVIMFTHPSDSDEARYHTVGRPISPHDEVKILRPGTEEELPLGEVGESAFRGPYTVHGYYDAAERNAEAFTSDGFYRSGDLMSKRLIGGKIYHVYEGRIKDVVDRGGEKINAEEVETAVNTHPAVAASAVIGLKDPLLGERMCVCMVLQPGAQAPTVASLGQHLQAYGLAKFKWPERIEVIAELPVTHVGKLDKLTLRQRYA
ncbi:AMP-binding protein [Hydrogenophaga sp. ZJX-1]|uniref:AMP-binding protein n=1 Tax=Hydrogenophaga sp. ZJX-1 TaxID=3404778 RepID=UPI003B27F7BE